MEVMDITKDYITQVERQLLHVMVSAVENGTLTLDQAIDAAKEIIAQVEPASTHPALVSALIILSEQWPPFAQVANVEMARVIEGQKKAVVKNALSLAEKGDIDKALAVAKSLQTN